MTSDRAIIALNDNMAMGDFMLMLCLLRLSEASLVLIKLVTVYKLGHMTIRWSDNTIALTSEFNLLVQSPSGHDASIHTFSAPTTKL